MSGYARLIKSVNARVIDVSTAREIVLPVGAPVKNIKIDKFYAYRMRVLIDREWLVCVTDDDLPAHTERGAEHRAKHAGGRPRLGAASTTGITPVAIRLNCAQLKWIRARSVEQGVSVSEFVRRLLVAVGLPV